MPTFQPSAQATSQAVSSSSSGSSIVQRVTQTAQTTKRFLATPQPGYIDLGKNNLTKDIQTVQWTCHGYKHFPQKNKTWKEIVKSTKEGPAKYKSEINIELIERHAWKNGINVTNGKPWKVIKFDQIIGAKKGIETQYMRVECSSNTIHGHPITYAEFKKLTK